MESKPWVVEVDELGRVTRCEVDGHPLAGIAAAELQCAPGQAPALTLYPRVAGTLAGTSIVQVVNPDASKATVLQWLDTLSAETLEARALESMGFGGPESTGAAFLAALRAEAEALD